VEVGYKAFQKEVIEKIAPSLASRDFGLEIEITAKIARLPNLNLKIYEVGISYWGRTYQEGKKIRWQDGLKACWYVVKYNLFFNKIQP